MDRFRKLLDEVGEEEMLSNCYTFMTLSTLRPTEEQREILEAKFTQDKRFEYLRSGVTLSTIDQETMTDPSIEQFLSARKKFIDNLENAPYLEHNINDILSFSLVFLFFIFHFNKPWSS